MRRRTVLLGNALYSLVLGALLIDFREQVVDALGMPSAECCFYPSLLGAVAVGFAAALVIEAANESPFAGTSALTMAFCMNLCSGSMLLVWLIAAEFPLTLRGRLLLWFIASVAFVLAVAELRLQRRASRFQASRQGDGGVRGGHRPAAPRSAS